MTVEKKRRSVIKAVSWRLLATVITMTIVFTVTGKVDLTLIVGGLDAFVKTVLYYFHERMWSRVQWGK